MVTPVPALILTLSPGLIKPTFVPFACNSQPLRWIASATFFALASTLPSVGAVIAPVLVFVVTSPDFTLKVKFLLLC